MSSTSHYPLYSFNTANSDDSQLLAGPSYESFTSPRPPIPDRPHRLRSLRPWSFSHRRSPTQPSPPLNQVTNGSSVADKEIEDVLASYEQLRVREPTPPRAQGSERPKRPTVLTDTIRANSTRHDSRDRSGGRRWSDSDEDDQVDSYSWIDPSVVGSEDLRRTVSCPLPGSLADM